MKKLTTYQIDTLNTWRKEVDKHQKGKPTSVDIEVLRDKVLRILLLLDEVNNLQKP